jgi:hypothetical protein
MTRRELRKARETVATLVRVQQQTYRLRAAVQAVRRPSAAVCWLLGEPPRRLADRGMDRSSLPTG